MMDIIENIINEWANFSFVLNEADVKSDKFVKAAQKRLGGVLKDKLANDTDLQNKADEIGINKDYTANGMIQARADAYPNLNINPEITEKVKKVVQILRQITNSTGGNNFSKLQTMVDNGETYGLSYNEILRTKDFIDSQDLRYMYDQSVDPQRKNYLKFGNKLDDNGQLDDSEFDLNNITDKHANAWLKGGDRKEQYTVEESYFEARRGVLNKYLMSSYGVEAKVPNFSTGNAKVTDALLINFTSAYRCPAWNECLVKHACYARSGEGTYYHNEKISNDRKHLMWEAGHNDPQLMKLIVDMLKAYVVDYGSASKEIMSEARSNWKNQDFIEFFNLVGKKVDMEKFSQLDFHKMPQSILDILKNHTRVKDIRLNENGDFIAQWLLDEMDRVAGDFRLIGVNTAAYSCRNLNFEQIKNIVINASRISMKGNAIARYFYALPAVMYDNFDDTYGGMTVSDEFNAIQRIPQPLYDLNGNPNGNYYYKCPCGRTDFSIGGKKPSKKDKINCYQCHLCYEAPDEDIINKLQSGGKYIVFVKAHGAGANLLNKEREEQVANSVGVSKSYVFGQENDGSAYANDDQYLDFDSDAVDDSMFESVEMDRPMSDENVIDDPYAIITDNAISSMNEHLGGIFNQESNSIQEQRQIFTNLFNKII